MSQSGGALSDRDSMEANVPFATLAKFAAAVAGAITLHFGWTYWIFGKIFFYHEIAALDLLVYALAFGLLWLALLDAPRWRPWIGRLVLAAVVCTAVAGTYVWTHSLRQVYSTDVIAFQHYAASLFLHGVDPYTVSLLPAFKQFHVPMQYQTLTWDGRIVDRLSYPAGSFLVFAPFVALGVSDLRWIVLVFHLAVIAVLYWASPLHLRPLVLLPMFGASQELVDFSYNGVVDFPWVLPVLLLIVYQRRPVLAGVFYGIACSIKQEPWILGPFLIVYFLKQGPEATFRRRLVDLAWFTLPAAAIFLVVNAPFVVHDPVSWVLGTLEPAIGNLIPIGQGPSVLTQLGFPLPSDAYTLGVAGIAAMLLVNYAVYFDRLRDAIWVFPMIITWFMPRSLHNYFVFWIPALGLVLALRAGAAGGTRLNAT